MARAWSAIAAAAVRTRTVISLFAYENPAIDRLLEQWRDARCRSCCLCRKVAFPARLPGSSACRPFAAGAGDAASFAAYALGFVEQPRFDALLWAADLNFVRGEDSFVRAQWARKPFVWHIYPQADDAHLPKLDAALAHYANGLPDGARDALARFWHAWNGAGRRTGRISGATARFWNGAPPTGPWNWRALAIWPEIWRNSRKLS